jgi:hypothetical protein
MTIGLPLQPKELKKGVFMLLMAFLVGLSGIFKADKNPEAAGKDRVEDFLLRRTRSENDCLFI